ncbi:MAG: sulfite reductase (ferredoxin), partial [Saprospiraceae bacterium]
LIYQIKVYPPTKDFASNYIGTASKFLNAVKVFRQEQIIIKN